MTSEEFYQNKCIKESQRFQAEIDKLKAEVAELNDLVSVITENKDVLFSMFTKAIQQLVYEKQNLMECCYEMSDGLNAINNQDSIIQDYYSFYSELDEKHHQITGEYLI